MNSDKIIKVAKELGLKVTLDSSNPGIYIKGEDGNCKEVGLEDIFTELTQGKK